MSNYTPFIKKLNFSKSIINEEFNLISSSFENQPLFSLGYHYYLNQVREKMESDDLQKRNFYRVFWRGSVLHVNIATPLGVMNSATT